jgi:hypothetical protein
MTRSILKQLTEACKIFISSTMDDLKDLRKNVADIITKSENVPIMAENIVDVGSPKEIIEQKLDECDCYLGIFDRRWGYVPPDDNPEKLSVTAIEYQRAKKNRIPRLILISKKGKEKELEEFIDKFSHYEKGNWRNDYEDEAELLSLVTRGIPKLISKAHYSIGLVEDKENYLSVMPPIVSPSVATYYDQIEDIDLNEIEYITEKILHRINSDALLSAWSDLEIFTRSKRIWKHKSVWDVLDKEIFAFDKSDHINDAIFIIKGMCFTSKRDNTDEVVIHVRQSYMQALEHILGSEEEKLINSKPDIKQILEYTSTQKERFFVFWRAWKMCAKIKNDHQYSRSITAFITDLEKADPKYKSLIWKELYDLIEKSPDLMIRKRAKELKSLLFS